MAASFTRNGKGKYGKYNNIYSMMYGENAYLLEDELNEMQWNLIDKSTEMMNSIIGSGSLKEFSLIANVDANTFYIQSLDTEPLLFALNGKNMALGANKVPSQPSTIATQDNRLIVKLNAATAARTDLVILETWYEARSHSQGLTKFGGESTDAINYSIMDPRINTETSRRMQYRWRIRVIDSATDITTVTAVNHAGTDTGALYKKQGDCYVVEQGAISDSTGSYVTDGIVTAIPLFTVVRKSTGNIVESDINPKFTKSRFLIDMHIEDLNFDILQENTSYGLKWKGLSDLHSITVEEYETGVGESTRLVIYNMDDGDDDYTVFRSKINGVVEDVLSVKATRVISHKTIHAEKGTKYNNYKIEYNATEDSLDFVYDTTI